MTLTRLILGLLALSPMTGYDIKKHVDTAIRHFWAADKAQVYRALAALVADGLATVEVVPQSGRPDRLEHHITQAGRTALREWLTSPMPALTERDPFLARLFFAGALDADQVHGILAQRRRQAEAMVQTLAAMRTEPGATEPETTELGSTEPGTTASGTYLRVATLENGLAHARAELAWLDAVEADLP